MNRYIPLILAGVLLNAAAQICLKQGMKTIGHFDFVFGSIVPTAIKVIGNVYVLLGMACYAVSIVVWLMVLSRVDVSYAYPLLSVGYIVTAFAGKAFFGEASSPVRWAGIFVICFGVYLITRSA